MCMYLCIFIRIPGYSRWSERQCCGCCACQTQPHRAFKLKCPRQAWIRIASSSLICFPAMCISKSRVSPLFIYIHICVCVHITYSYTYILYMCILTNKQPLSFSLFLSLFYTHTHTWIGAGAATISPARNLSLSLSLLHTHTYTRVGAGAATTSPARNLSLSLSLSLFPTHTPHTHMKWRRCSYGVATSSRLLKRIGLFCRIKSLL